MPRQQSGACRVFPGHVFPCCNPLALARQGAEWNATASAHSDVSARACLTVLPNGTCLTRQEALSMNVRGLRETFTPDMTQIIAIGVAYSRLAVNEPDALV